ncbi:MAG: hypothetical protein Q4D06_09660 [Coriobacteriia bacterium]|nr:hypothetical protein [Coriobacteriia bacterium]
MQMYWPIALAVVADVAYQIASKQTPAEINPFASPTLAYLVGAAASALIYFLTNSGGNIIGEWKLANWTTVVLGIAVVGLEAGSIYMFRLGWGVSVGPLVKNALIAIALLLLGLLAYKEPITASKIAGVGACLVGLWLINK